MGKQCRCGDDRENDELDVQTCHDELCKLLLITQKCDITKKFMSSFQLMLTR